MTLRIKTLGILVATFVGLLTVVYLVSRLVLLDSYDSLERDNVRVNVQRVLNALSNDLDDLDAELQNWVKLIDVSNVEAEPDAAFSRLLTEAFTNSQINFTMVIDSSSRIIFSKAIDLQTGMDVPFPESFGEHFAANDLLLRHSSPDSNLTGLIGLPEALMLVTSRPVPDGASGSPVGGTMLFARRLNDARVNDLGRSTQLTLEVQRVNKLDMPSDLQEALLASSDEEPTVVRRVDDDRVHGYTLLRDIYEEPIAVIKADMSSTIYQRGQSTLTYLLITVVTVGTLFGLVTLLGLERLVLSRLARLGADVESVAATTQHSARVSVSGQDELSRLGHRINAMLEQLDSFHSKTLEMEKERGERAVEVERARGQEAEAVARAEALERSRTRILAVSESLRREIARHLHGSVQNKLILVLNRISRLGQDSPDELAVEVAEIREELERLIEDDVRKISVQIYPGILRRGLVPSLESLGDRFHREITVEKDLDPDIARRERTNSDTVPEQVRLSAYRVAEEALTNTLKHAEADRVTIALKRPSEDWLRLTVSDDGRGFDVEAESEGVGLGTMRDYAGAVGGRVAIESSHGTGTTVTAMLPLRPADGGKSPEGSSSPNPHPPASSSVADEPPSDV